MQNVIKVAGCCAWNIWILPESYQVQQMPSAADGILRTLESHGLHWDEDIMWQSHRTEAYQETFKRLQAIEAVYPCSCTRKEIADSGLHGIDGQIYPGTCRNGPVAERGAYAWRVRSDHAWQAEKRTDVIALNDVLQGYISHHLEKEIGDFVVKRGDGLYTYQLAVVVDDACQHISHIVRGAGRG